jgi:hypothetical protein
MAADLEYINGVISYAQAASETLPWWNGIDGMEPTIIPAGEYNRSDWENAGNFNFDVTMEEMVTLVDGIGEVKDSNAFVRPVRRWRNGDKLTGAIDLLGGPRTEQYELVQASEMFDFAETIVQLSKDSGGHAYIATLGSVRNGNRNFISVNLGNNTVVAPNGWQDTNTGYVSITNSFDGFVPFAVLNNALRIVCANTQQMQLAIIAKTMKAEKGSLRGNFISGKAMRLRHTKKIHDRIEDGKKAIAEHNEWQEAYNLYAMQLMEAKMTTKQFSDMVRDLVLGDEELKGGAIYNDRKAGEAMSAWNVESQQRGGANAWSAMNAVTHMTSHISLAKGTPLAPTNQLAIQLGFDNKGAAKAKSLIDLTNAWFVDKSIVTV